MLWKKMLRDILSSKGSYLACILLILLGLVVFTSFSILRDNLYLSKEQFYREQNFAHGFVELESMPRGNVEKLSRLEGIEDLCGRIVKEVRVYDPQREESVYLKLVSLDLEKPRRVNDVRLLKGEELTGGDKRTWIDKQFYEANDLEMHQELEIIADGRLKTLNVTGAGMSPEFTYPLRDLKELYPNPEQFGIAFVPLDDIVSLFPELRGTVNNLVFTLEPGVDFETVKNNMEPELEQYGLRSIYQRDEQVSHLILTEEITQLDNMSRVLPMLFLLVASIILYIMLKRLVEQQRGQIGILKALGYTDMEVLFHYLSYALVVGSIGGIIGGILGIWLSVPLTNLLMEFFNVPEVHESFSLFYLFAGIVISLLIFLFAGYHGCKNALRLNPAEAMRPSAPTFAKKVLLERLRFFWEMLTIQGKMAARNLSRNRSRTVFMFLGITVSCAVVAITWSLNDVIDKLAFYQFEEVEVYDAQVNLTAPLDRTEAEQEIWGLEEVTRAEPLIEAPVSLSHRWREEDVLLLGITANSRLYNILDADGNRIVPPREGIILSERLAGKLGVSQGDVLELESPLFRGEDDSKKVPLVEVIPQYLGMNAYMEISALEEILGQDELATSFLLNVAGTEDGRGRDGLSLLRERYRESDVVAGIDGREERMAQTRELMETFGSVVYLYVFIGVITCFSIIYSSSFIILSERGRELASMMVLGMTPREVFSVIAFEQWFVSIFAVIAGLPLAKLMQWGVSRELSSDLYTIPADLSAESLFAGLVITLISIWLAQRFVLSKIEKLSLIEVLKTRE